MNTSQYTDPPQRPVSLPKQLSESVTRRTAFDDRPVVALCIVFVRSDHSTPLEKIRSDERFPDIRDCPLDILRLLGIMEGLDCIIGSCIVDLLLHLFHDVCNL